MCDIVPTLRDKCCACGCLAIDFPTSAANES